MATVQETNAFCSKTYFGLRNISQKLSPQTGNLNLESVIVFGEILKLHKYIVNYH